MGYHTKFKPRSTGPGFSSSEIRSLKKLNLNKNSKKEIQNSI